MGWIWMVRLAIKLASRVLWVASQYIDFYVIHYNIYKAAF